MVVGSFYTTYKELKHNIKVAMSGMNGAFILPIRNWNQVHRICLVKWSLGFYTTYKELKQYR